jgi:hypothetical protein
MRSLRRGCSRLRLLRSGQARTTSCASSDQPVRQRRLSCGRRGGGASSIGRSNSALPAPSISGRFGPLAAGEVGDPYVVVSVDCRYQRHMKSPHRRLGAKANPLLVPLLVSAIHGSETPRLAHSRGLHRCGHAIDDIDSGPSAPRGTCGILRHGRCDGDIIPVVGAPDIARGVD